MLGQGIKILKLDALTEHLFTKSLTMARSTINTKPQPPSHSDQATTTKRRM